MDNYGKLELIATCLFGLESLVADEIRRLGYDVLATTDGRVTFGGDALAVARCSLWLRCAERVLIKAGEFDAPTFDALFEGVRAIEWERFVPRGGAFPVSGHALKSQLHSIPDCQAIIKKAAATRLGAAYGINTLPEDDARYAIQFLIMKDRACLMIDTSGEALHKRGYRERAGDAPLRETIAAAMVKLARWRAGDPLCDPFCGSGTIAIEASLIGENRAPGLRRRFAAMDFAGIPQTVWQEASSEALEAIVPREFRVSASDIDAGCIELAKQNAHIAGVAAHIDARQADAREAELSEGRFARIITNPPYGERMLDITAAQALIRDMGKKLAGCAADMYFLSADDQFETLFGRLATKRRKLYNGMKTCQLYQYLGKR